MKFVTEEESTEKNGATLMVYGTKVTKGGAAFAFAQLLAHAREHLANGPDEEATRQRLANWLLQQAIHGEATLGEHIKYRS